MAQTFATGRKASCVGSIQAAGSAQILRWACRWHDCCIRGWRDLRFECRTLINSDVDRSPSSSNRAWTELRALAAWYRGYAETAGNPAIWASRVTTAEELELEAAALENRPGWLDRSAQYI